MTNTTAKHACADVLSKPYPKHGTAHLVQCGIVLNLLPYPHVPQMDQVVPMTRGTTIVARACSPVIRMYMTAMPVLTMLAMAENHIKTNSIGFQCVVEYCYEQTITDMNEPLFVSTTNSIGFQCVIEHCYEQTITDMNEPLFVSTTNS